MKGLFGVFGCKISKFRPTSERLPPDFFDFRQPSALITHYYICQFGAGAAFSRTHVKPKSGSAARHCDGYFKCLFRLCCRPKAPATLQPPQRSGFQHVARGRLRACHMPPFAAPFAAFRPAKGGLLLFIRKLVGWRSRAVRTA